MTGRHIDGTYPVDGAQLRANDLAVFFEIGEVATGAASR